MKKRFGTVIICSVLCIALLGSCQAGQSDIPAVSAWSADTVFTPMDELSWPEACLDEKWPDGGFEKNVAELSFDGLDLKESFTMGLQIAYENEEVLIFWGQQGVFGVELSPLGNSCEIVFSIDFEKLFGESGIIQGSNVNTVAVRKDGTRMVVGNWRQSGAAEDDWCIVDLPTLTYEKTAVHAQMKSYIEPPDSTFWTDEVFDSADAEGWIECQGCLGEAVYILNRDGSDERVIHIFKNYMEFVPFP